MKKTARVIVTLKCNRKCSYCVNKQSGTLKSAEKIWGIEALLCGTFGRYDSIVTHDEFLITGGEPMLDPLRVHLLAMRIKCAQSDAKVYLYTALHVLGNAGTSHVLYEVDGIHYTIHRDATPKDILLFRRFQDMIEPYKDKSFRLFIEQGVKHQVPVIPNRWKRVEVKPFMIDCPLPENETLYILEEG